MAQLIGQSFWLALSVTITGIAHMVVVKKDWLSALKVPLDGGLTFRGRRLFGENKTWRGVAFMIVASAIIGGVQGWLGGTWADAAGAACIDFDQVGQWVRTNTKSLAYATGYATVSAVLGLGYVLGELPNSFLKRRVGIRPGTTMAGAVGLLFFLADQADSVVAALGLTGIGFSIGWGVFVTGSLCLTGLHLLLNATLYYARVRKNL